MPEQLGYFLINYSFLSLAIGERLVFLSVFGLLVVLLAVKLFDVHPAARARLWWVYLLWLVPAATPLLPGVPVSWLEQTWVAKVLLVNPCSILPIERLGHVLLGSSSFFTGALGLALVWSCISFWLLARIIYKRYFFIRLVAQAKSLEQAPVFTLLQQLAPKYALNRRVYLCSSPDYPAPFTMGFFRPVIFLPERMLEQLSEPTLRAVLAHELAHIARRDDAAILWQHGLRAVFFFNPLLRYADRQLSLAREVCCDTLAIKRCNIDSRDYGRALLSVVDYFRLVKPEQVPVAGFLSRDIDLRVRSLCSPPSRRKGLFAPVAFVICTCLAVSAFLGGTGKPLAPILDVQKARALLMQLQPVSPLPGSRMTSGVDLVDSLGCPLPARDSYHTGVDLTPSGGSTAVHAFADGRIKSISRPPGGIGKIVRIEHKYGLVSTYARLDSVALGVGDSVTTGQPFARVGATWRTDHLHFEVTHQGRVVDPAFLFE